jgi:hypothetical protein
VALQELSLIHPLPPKPAGDLGIALARIARATGRHHVVERVPPTTRYGEDAVTLKRAACDAAVSTSSPRSLQRPPLDVGQIVSDKVHAAFASAGRPNFSTPAHWHLVRVGPPVVGSSGRRTTAFKLRGKSRAEPVRHFAACRPGGFRDASK